jgi:hypothetical protein
MVASRRKKREKARKSLHFRRVTAQIKITGGNSCVHDVRVILNDLSPKGLGLFSPVNLHVGQEVAITLEKPRRFYVKARVVYSHPLEGAGKVITDCAFGHRVGLEFVLDSPEEAQAVTEFCEEMNRLYVTLGLSA